MPGSEQDVHYTLAPAPGQNGRGAPMKCRYIATVGLGC